jgi:5'-3' exonuclease
MGDPTDNIPGLKGMGDKKAEALLATDSPDEWWDTISAMYMEQYNDPWVIYEQAILLWILREYGQEKKPIDFRAYVSGTQ